MVALRFLDAADADPGKGVARQLASFHHVACGRLQRGQPDVANRLSCVLSFLDQLVDPFDGINRGYAGQIPMTEPVAECLDLGAPALCGRAVYAGLQVAPFRQRFERGDKIEFCDRQFGKASGAGSTVIALGRENEVA